MTRNHFVGGPLGFYVTDIAWDAELHPAYDKFREQLLSTDYSLHGVGCRSVIHDMRYRYRTLIEALSASRLGPSAVLQYAAITRYLGAMEALVNSKSNSVDKFRDDSLACFFALQFHYAANRFFEENSLTFKPIDPENLSMGFLEDPEHETWMKLLELKRQVLASFLVEKNVSVEQFLKYRHFYDQLPEHFGFEVATESDIDRRFKERFGFRRGFDPRRSQN